MLQDMFITQNELKRPNEDVKDNVMLLTFVLNILFCFGHAHTLGLSLMCQVDHLDSHFMLQDMFITQNELKRPNEDV